MKTIRVQLDHLKKAIWAVMPHASKDDITPILTRIQLASHADGFKLVATDRYTCARYIVDGTPEGEEPKGLAEVSGEFDVLMSLDWAKQVVSWKEARNKYVVSWVDITISESEMDGRKLSEITTSYNGQQYTELGMAGSYPDVESIMDNCMKSEMQSENTDAITIGWKQLKKLDMFSMKAMRDGAYTFQFTKTDNPRKPGPVVVLAPEYDGYSVIIQPNLVVT